MSGSMDAAGVAYQLTRAIPTSPFIVTYLTPFWSAMRPPIIISSHRGRIGVGVIVAVIIVLTFFLALLGNVSQIISAFAPLNSPIS